MVQYWSNTCLLESMSGLLNFNSFTNQSPPKQLFFFPDLKCNSNTITKQQRKTSNYYQTSEEYSQLSFCQASQLIPQKSIPYV
jgi:hypothetical protein